MLHGNSGSAILTLLRWPKRKSWIDGVPSGFSDMCEIEEMKSARHDLTIDASGPSPEEDDECLNRHTQDLQRLTVLWLQQGPTSTIGEATAEIKKKITSIVVRLEQLSTQQQECLETLSTHGWFLSPDTPIDRNFHFELPLHPKTYASYPVVSIANRPGLFEVVVRHILAVLRSRCAGFACPACLAADTCPARPLLST